MEFNQMNFFEINKDLPKETRTVQEVIKEVKNHFQVTKEGKILAICNESEINYGNNNEDEVLGMFVKEIRQIDGVIHDRTGIRV